ncbi:hypothetical protein [Anaplasma phagocytophilum]|uniref:hypothetical protein n=1 Tax=Anaplasma phagocytophilum TaxID=948 RepID=UPI00200F4CEB|nr:hypothetical protein [Anaplasma phagocytophilum]UQD54257.1 hypothetical protein ESP60_02390 [Anaplasma phagocytophilum]
MNDILVTVAEMSNTSCNLGFGTFCNDVKQLHTFHRNVHVATTEHRTKGLNTNNVARYHGATKTVEDVHFQKASNHVCDLIADLESKSADNYKIVLSSTNNSTKCSVAVTLKKPSGHNVEL